MTDRACPLCGHAASWHVMSKDHARYGECEHPGPNGHGMCPCPGFSGLDSPQGEPPVSVPGRTHTHDCGRTGPKGVVGASCALNCGCWCHDPRENPQPVTLRAKPSPGPQDVMYVPWTNGRAIGFRCVWPSGKETYVYLNPSSEDSEGKPNVFVYSGPDGDPGTDPPDCYIYVD